MVEKLIALTSMKQQYNISNTQKMNLIGRCSKLIVDVVDFSCPGDNGYQCPKTSDQPNINQPMSNNV